jgi:ribosome modulation factor
MDQDRDPAFTNGYECGRTGTSRTANPHSADSAEARKWLIGWDEGSARREWVNAKPDPDANSLVQQRASRGQALAAEQAYAAESIAAPPEGARLGDRPNNTEPHHRADGHVAQRLHP